MYWAAKNLTRQEDAAAICARGLQLMVGKALLWPVNVTTSLIFGCLYYLAGQYS